MHDSIVFFMIEETNKRMGRPGKSRSLLSSLPFFQSAITPFPFRWISSANIYIQTLVDVNPIKTL